MRKNEKHILEYAVLAVIGIACLLFALGLRNTDLSFSRRVFAGLVEGRALVKDSIDWTTFKALGEDMSATYLKLKDTKQKLDFQRAFVKGFSLGFKKGGGRLKAFTNWRVYAQDKAKTVIATDYPSHKKTLLLTVATYYGKRKLVAMQWKE